MNNDNYGWFAAIGLVIWFAVWMGIYDAGEGFFMAIICLPAFYFGFMGLSWLNAIVHGIRTHKPK